MTTRATAGPRPHSPLNVELSPRLPTVAREAATVLDLNAVSRALRAGQEIVSEGRRCNAVFLIITGIAIRYRILRDGQRQILNFLLPGDFAGISSCRFQNALVSIKTLTPAAVAPIPLKQLVGLVETQPQLAARLFWWFSSEQTILAERLIAIGRRAARERIAHFLLELLVRLQNIGLADEQSYHLPLTQETISDALGLSIPYVNRVLGELRDAGLVHIKDRQVIIDDVEELSALADFEHAYLKPASFADLMSPPQAQGGGGSGQARQTGKDSESFLNIA